MSCTYVQQEHSTVDAGYKNPSSIYWIICILFHWISSRYKNIILENGCHIPYIFYAGYKNMFLDNEYCL